MSTSRSRKAKIRPGQGTLRQTSPRRRSVRAQTDGIAPPDQELMGLVRRQIELFGEDPNRDGLRRTPKRVAEALRFLTRGYQEDPKTVLNDALFETTTDEMVIVKDIDFYSLCEHHILPFFGKCHIAYLPTNKVV